MKIDSISLTEGSDISNITVQSGPELPLLPDVGQLFYETGNSVGLKIYNGSSWDVVNIQSSSTIPKMTVGTYKTSTSGKFVDFSPIPDWAKKVTVIFLNVSTNGTSIIKMLLGTSSLQTSGYTSTASTISSYVSTSTSTAGFITGGGGPQDAKGTIRNGTFTFVNIYNDSWVLTGHMGSSADSSMRIANGSVTLSGKLNSLRITTVNGSDSFDGGSINILCEG